MDVIENKAFYVSQSQRNLLIELIKEPVISKNFFLTGGTALSVFYLNHRKSEDIDLFSISDINLPEIGFWLKRKWKEKATAIKESVQSLSLLIENIKVDIVIDPLSFNEKRPVIFLEEGLFLQIDTLSNIVSNKLTACASRTEPKDYIDLYYILKKYPDFQFEQVFLMANKKDAMFDDPPTVAYQIEDGIEFIKRNKDLLPKIETIFDLDDFLIFFEKLTKWIYERGRV